VDLQASRTHQQSHVVVAGLELNCAAAAITIAAFLSVADPRERPADQSQLADLARKVPKSKAGFLSIEGIGEAKATRYAGAFLTVLCTMPEPEVEAVQQAQAEGSATDSEVVISAAVPAMTAD
jgi:HrpA-like RNA helicase